MSEVSAATLGVGATSTGNYEQPGTTFELPGNRKFVLRKFTNTSAIAAGAHVYSAVTTSSALAITTTANGQLANNLVAPSQQLMVVTTGAVAADAYAGGYALVTANSAADTYSLRIAHNTGTASAGNITLVFEENLYNTTALVPGTDTVTLSTSPDTVTTTTATGNVDCGYTVNAVPAVASGSAVYGWTQVSGQSVAGPQVVPLAAPVLTGTATLVGGTVTVANTSITANSIIWLANKTIGGTAGALFISAKTASTSFAITSTSGTDTSVVQYYIMSY